MATSNTINPVEVYARAIDEKYRQRSKTAFLETDSILVQPQGSGKVKIPKVSLDGTIGKYSTTTGFTKAFIKQEYQEVEKDIDLSIQVGADYVENLDGSGLAFNAGAKLASDLFIPAIDALRISSICQKAGITTKDDTFTTGKSVVTALRTATVAMADKNVPQENRVTFILPEIVGMLNDMDSYNSKQILTELGKIVVVTPNIFYTKAELDSSNAAGYKKSEGAKDINFLILDKDAVLAKTVVRTKMFSANQMQTLDEDVMMIRQFGLSAYVLDNKVDSIYVSTKPTA